MKKLFPVLILLLACSPSHAQDSIVKKNGVIIIAKVLELAPVEIKYKNYDDPNGPTYSIPKTEVRRVHFQNGYAEVFEDAAPPVNYFVEGNKDALNNYRGYKPAATITLITSLISPLAGLVPAIATSSFPPNRKRNLNCPDPDLLENRDYATAYTRRAKRIKSNKVWTNWSIGLAVNVIAILLLTQ